MNYYRLRDDIQYPNRWYAGDINVDDNWVFTYGKPVDGSIAGNLYVDIYQEGQIPDYTTTEVYGVPIVSEGFAHCVSEYTSDIQLIPVTIQDMEKDYYILVVKNRIDCVDE